jgi:hypothetical protein
MRVSPPGVPALSVEESTSIVSTLILVSPANAKLNAMTSRLCRYDQVCDGDDCDFDKIPTTLSYLSTVDLYSELLRASIK